MLRLVGLVHIRVAGKIDFPVMLASCSLTFVVQMVTYSNIPKAFHGVGYAPI